MLDARFFRPQPGEILYHYCSPEAFHAICTSKKLRFTDVFSMNDSMEMHWGYQIWESAAGNVLEVIGKEFLDKIDEIIHFGGLFSLPTACCLSLDGDVLSQWRAYSFDGSGYAIGFDAQAMAELPARPIRVLYEQEKQILEVSALILAIHSVEQERKPEDQFGDDFRRVCQNLAFDLVALKNPAFREEMEVRLVHLLQFKESNNFLKLVDPGGHASGGCVEPTDVQFCLKRGIPAAYADLDFSENNARNAIKEVILGPRNHALPTGISVYLETMGIGDVTVRRSKASYR